MIHGLAFATTLSELGLGRLEHVASILGFNRGIETMQLIVVARHDAPKSAPRATSVSPQCGTRRICRRG
ncbi:MAG: hypothetical protein DMG97_38410 [Acidobacteria bacterium]|nr:MAG: hypothetical protein DMG24_05785 [Acidobacteriota bacterium]PYV63178.1 MAG: hypothetical protein DMG97_38410 [Acidobacteriota bacterium]